MKKTIFTLLASLALSACMTQADLDATPTMRQVTLDENYQAVYARAFSAIRTCNSAAEFSSVGQVDGQLYPDLGYGEISVGVSATLGYMALHEVRIDREGDGARVGLKTQAGQAVNGEGHILNWLEYWIRGGRQCPVRTFGEIPPPVPTL